MWPICLHVEVDFLRAVWVALAVFVVPGMTDSQKEIIAFELGDAKYEEYKARIEALKLENKAEVFRKPTRSSGLLEKDARTAVKMADEAYSCGEWLDAGRLYIELTEAKVGPMSMIARLAVCHHLFGDPFSGFTCVKKALVDCPLESDTYLAMGLIKQRVRQFSVALRWLDLAELALRPNRKMIASARAEIEALAILQAEELAAFRTTMKTVPDWLQIFIEKEDQTDVDDLPGAIEALKRIQENPERLEFEADNHPDVQALVWMNWANSSDAFPRRYSEENTAKLAQPGCAAHTIDSIILANIAKHSSLPSLLQLQRTCKFFSSLGRFPEVCKSLYLLQGFSPIELSWWGQKFQSWYWFDGLRIYAFIKDFLALMVTWLERQGMMDEATYQAQRSRSLSQLHLRHRLFADLASSQSTKHAWAYIADFISQTSSSANATQMRNNPHFWPVLSYCLADTTVKNYLDQAQSMITTYIAAIIFGGSMSAFIDFSPMFFPLLGGLIHNDASAALAVHFARKRLAELKFKTVCDTKETIQRLTPEKMADRFDLSGIWHGVEISASASLEKTIQEEVAMNLKFSPPDLNLDGGPNPFEMIGMGVDCMGEFELEDPLMDQLRFVVTFTKVYKNVPGREGGELRLMYEGALYSSGMGGHYGLPPDERGIQQLGYWFMGRPQSAVEPESWDQIVSVVNQKKAEIMALRDTLPVEDTSNLMALRSVKRTRLLARTESTSITRLREGIEEMQDWIEGSDIIYEPDYAPFETDNEEKAALRVQLLTGVTAFIARCTNTIFIENVHRFPAFVATLERLQCDKNEPEVMGIMLWVSRQTVSFPTFNTENVRRCLDLFKQVLEYHNNVGQAMAEEIEENEEDAGQNQARVPNAVSQFMKRTIHGNNAGSDENEEDSDSEDDSDWEDAPISRKSKRRQAGLSTSTVLIIASVASAAAIAGAFVLGRFLSRKRSNE